MTTSLPLHIRQALERDRDRQMTASYEARHNLVKYVTDVCGQISDNALPEEWKLTLERDINRYLDAVVKTYGDSVSIREFIQGQEENGQPNTTT
jgi:hypothetical protein